MMDKFFVASNKLPFDTHINEMKTNISLKDDIIGLFYSPNIHIS